MTRKELLKKYEEVKDNDDLQIALYIHMPDDSIETIYNEKAHEKIKYVLNTYDENLIHKNSYKIYIIDVLFACENVKDNLDFGVAIKNIRHGNKMSRKGWNGKETFIYYVPSGNYKPVTDVATKSCTNTDGLVPYGEYIAMKTVDGTVVPWLASQEDVLARDWMIVEDV